MNIIIKRKAVMLLIGACLLFSLPITAQKPRWVDKGEKSMNKQRSNDSYYFKIFNTYGMDANKLKAERYEPLLTYVRERYGADYKEMELDSLRLDSDTLTTYYRITFTDASGKGTVYAQRVDEHLAYEDYVDDTFQFEYYQLYAVSGRDTLPVFDDFKLTKKYSQAALALSIIPGMGQIYKGQKAKGFAILGSEALLVTSAVAFQYKKNYCKRKANENPNLRANWKSKARGWRQMSTLCYCVAGGLYAYNLLDAALLKGSRHVVVKKKSDGQLFIVPSATFDGAGMTFSYNF